MIQTEKMINDNNVVYGVHAVLAALTDTPTLIEKVYVKEGLASRDMPTIYNTCKSNRIPITMIPNDYKMNDIAGTVNHQGLVAMIRDFEYLEIDEIIKLIDKNKKENIPNLIIIMDEIEDPHNVGAIIRTAVAVDAVGIIVPKHRQAPIGGAVYKSSVGLVAQIPIARVSNIGVVIEKLKQNHVWVGSLAMNKDIIQKDVHTKSDIHNKNNLWNMDIKGDMAIIIGNESKGVSKHNIANSDFVISIPMNEKVESLNASVSAAIAMYEWRRQNLHL